MMQGTRQRQRTTREPACPHRRGARGCRNRTTPGPSAHPLMPNRVRQFVYWVRGGGPEELLRLAKHQVNRGLRRLPSRPCFACHVRCEHLFEALVPRMRSRHKNPFKFLAPVPPGIASPARNVFSREPRCHHADFPVFQFENDYISAIDRRCILYIQSDFIRRSIKQPHHANSLSLWDKNSNRGSGNRPSKARHIDAFRKCPAACRSRARRSAHPLLEARWRRRQGPPKFCSPRWSRQIQRPYAPTQACGLGRQTRSRHSAHGNAVPT